MEMELEPRVKPLPYKVKAMSRESPSQKALHVLDADLRTHWSTATNTKEWILLELDEPCLLSHLRIYNKSVLEWEIAVGLRYKPETFVKVRPRCEAPRRDMMYPMNYTPCRYVRISCLRGNPIAIFFIQLIGVSVTGLEPEFQPVVNHLLPHIISHKQDVHDMHLQLLQDMTNRLLSFLPQLEIDLTGFTDAAEPNLRFLAMLVGPFYPILHIVKERENARLSGSDADVSKNSQPALALTVSSNFEPRRSRSTSPSTSSSIVFRPDAIFSLLRKAYKDPDLGSICRLASRILHKFIGPSVVLEESPPSSEVTSLLDETSKSELGNLVPLVDYSNLFGEEFQIPDDHWDSSYISILDIAAVEEGILHVLYACASQPLLCRKLADNTSDFWSALPLVQALLPALRPLVNNSSDHVDDSFSQWRQPFVQQALSQIVATSSSPSYCPLLHACAGYLSSFSPSHAKAACVLIDMCSSVLAPWMAQVIAKIDLTVELLEDLLGIIQDSRHSLVRARAALKYIVLALSGHMDDVLGKYKEVKHKILFLVEMLEPFLDPAIYALRSTIAFGDVSVTFLEKQEHTCSIALNVIRAAVQKPAVLPSLESEWRRGLATPSVLLSILEPHMQLPPEIDLCKSPASPTLDHESATVPPMSSAVRNGGASSRPNNQDDSDGKVDVLEDVSLFFAPPDLCSIGLINVSNSPNEMRLHSDHGDLRSDQKHVSEQNFTSHGLVLDTGFSTEYFNLQANCFQLTNYRECELRASEFRRLASDLNSQHEVTAEGHNAAIDALLLAAECYVNPFFLTSYTASNFVTSQRSKAPMTSEISEHRRASERNKANLEKIAQLESERDKTVLQILLEAAELKRNFQKGSDNTEGVDEEVVKLSPANVLSADAVTLIRQNQALLFNFLVQRLGRGQHSMHEILLHCLVFLLHSATKLYCDPECVIDIILGSAEYLNGMLTSYYHQMKDENFQLGLEKIHGVQRRWMLLQKLVIASSGDDEGSNFTFNISSGVLYGNLIPPSAWMKRIPTFSCSASPLVRFLGWMGISRNAKQYTDHRLFLASDLPQLTYLLSIFTDELALVDNAVNRKHNVAQDSSIVMKFEMAHRQHVDKSFQVIYPDLSKFFPNMKKQFEVFGEIILEAVGLQLRSLSSSVLPDILCWFSDLCSCPFFEKKKSSDHLKGHIAKNAKAIILYILEAIVVEHMEAMVPEIPRVVQLLVCLCRTSYCDVPFLNSILDLLKPIISYSLRKVSDEEKTMVDYPCLNFESLCFDGLFNNIRLKNEDEDSSTEAYSRAHTIFILSSVLPDLSFRRRREMLQSLTLWADFTAFEPTTSFHDYLSAFQCVMENCKVLLVQTLQAIGFIPLQSLHFPDMSNVSGSRPLFLFDVCNNPHPSKVYEVQESNKIEEMEDFCKDLEGLIIKLNPTIELCWSLHHQLAKRLTVTSAECFVYLKCLSSIAQKHYITKDEIENPFPLKSDDESLLHWRVGIEGFAEIITMLQQKLCWQVESVMLDCILEVPELFALDSVISTICLAIKSFASSAPKIGWRLQTDKWLSSLLSRGVRSLNDIEEAHLSDLFCMMLGHSEPEQRFIAIQHLGKLVGQGTDGATVMQSSTFCNVVSVPENILLHLVSSTWDMVVVLASSDSLLPLRTRAMALIVDYIPFANRQHLQSFLAAADKVLHGLGGIPNPTCEGPLIQLSLALIAGACLYSPAEDLYLIPDQVWGNIETLASSNTGKVGDLEKRACQALCRLKSEGDEAKEVLREVISSQASNQLDPEFGSIRESILQVIANLTSAKSYLDLFSDKVDREDLELEEAEIELDILQKKHVLPESSHDSKDGRQIPSIAAAVEDNNRLQKIKDQIRLIEKSELQEDIVARRQKKLLMRHDRQRFLEEAALREAELLQELDRERAAEVEKEIERQRLLEQERAKTRELRHSLDIEKERQTQRELQRELEQAESGIRLPRRDFPSSGHSGRPRDRYRERDNGRPGNEASTRASGEAMTSGSPVSSMPTVVLSGSRAFSGQLPTILQSRDRTDEGGSGYEENLDGSKDSGDTGSIGDAELMSAFDGSSVGFGSGAQRHGSRGGAKSNKQVMERREREGRREGGKWERKH